MNTITLKKAKEKFRDHKFGAKKRGIDFQFTFDQWYKLWIESGHWEQRGTHSGDYCMGRHGDVGPYSADNVSIITVKKNANDCHKGKSNPNKAHKMKPGHQEKMQAGRK